MFLRIPAGLYNTTMHQPCFCNFSTSHSGLLRHGLNPNKLGYIMTPNCSLEADLRKEGAEFMLHSISAPPRSTQHDEKPLRLFWQFRPSTSNNNSTLYHNLLQDLSIRRKTRDRIERQFTQLLLSDGGQKKPAGKKPRGGKKSAGNMGRSHGSNS